MQYPKVYILVLNWNGWADTIECLESLLKLSYPDYQLIVVDNGSTDDSMAKISAWAAIRGLGDRLRIIETKQNLGYAGGNNAGLRYCLQQDDFGYVWVLNNDTVVDPRALTELVNRMREKPGAGLGGSMVLQYEERMKIAAVGGGFYDKWFAQATHPGAGKLYDPNNIERYLKYENKISYIEGASTLIARDFLRDVGLMNEEYFLFFEEIDWAARARGRYTLAIAPKSLVFHKGAASVKKKEAEEGDKKKRYSLVFDQYNTRNRLLFTLKYYPYALPVVYLSILGYLIDRLLHGAWRNVWTIIKAAGLPIKRKE